MTKGALQSARDRWRRLNLAQRAGAKSPRVILGKRY
jgi:hypothetical protein